MVLLVLRKRGVSSLEIKKILLLLLLLLFLFNFNICFGNSYYSYEDLNTFIEAYNTFYGTNYFHDFISTDIDNEKYVLFFACKDTDNNLIVCASRLQTIIWSKNPLFSFGASAIKFLLTDTSYSSTSVDLSTSDAFITEPFAFQNQSSAPVLPLYSYNFVTGKVNAQIEQQITLLSNKVENLENSSAGVSEKVDTVIDNQTIINNNISNTGDKINTTINSQGEQINTNLNNINENITTVPDDLTDNTNITSDDIKNSLDFELTVDPYANFWEHLMDGIQSSFINKNETFKINWFNEQYEINVNDVIPAYPSAFRQLLTIVSTTVLMFPILKYIKKTVDLISSGSADELLEMNEEEGYIDMF